MRLLFLFFTFSFCLTAQTVDVNQIFEKSGELYFAIHSATKQQLQQASKIVSIDHGSTPASVHAYANKKEFEQFLALNIPYTIKSNPSFALRDLNMLLSLNEKQANDWDYYPAYEVYTEMMYAFETNYPGLCKVSSIGTSVDGRELLVAKITDFIDEEEGEPRLLYTSSMHGDEITGFVLSLRLIDYLLVNYQTDNRVKEIVDHIEIWINPLANPDGAYRNDNSTVYGATRYNANGVDLNRNYPDPQEGVHPDGNSYQDETLAFMAFADSCEFDISSNFHGGAEVANYPWDTWSNTHADLNWWTYVMHEYADTAQANSNSSYFNSFDDGITNGYDWYEVAGGRQDYMNFEKHCREFTLELSNAKIPSAAQLPYYWEANYRSLLGYMEQGLYGLHGRITDSITSEPLRAKVYISGHDIDSSHVYSHLPLGDYHRFLASGAYDLTYSASGYHTKIVSAVDVFSNETSNIDVQLVPINVGFSENEMLSIKVYPQPAVDFVQIEGCSENVKAIRFIDVSGKIVKEVSSGISSDFSIPIHDLSKGNYILDFILKDAHAYKEITL